MLSKLSLFIIFIAAHFAPHNASAIDREPPILLVSPTPTPIFSTTLTPPSTQTYPNRINDLTFFVATLEGYLNGFSDIITTNPIPTPSPTPDFYSSSNNPESTYQPVAADTFLNLENSESTAAWVTGPDLPITVAEVRAMRDRFSIEEETEQNRLDAQTLGRLLGAEVYQRRAAATLLIRQALISAAREEIYSLYFANDTESIEQVFTKIVNTEIFLERMKDGSSFEAIHRVNQILSELQETVAGTLGDIDFQSETQKRILAQINQSLAPRGETLSGLARTLSIQNNSNEYLTSIATITTSGCDLQNQINRQFFRLFYGNHINSRSADWICSPRGNNELSIFQGLCVFEMECNPDDSLLSTLDEHNRSSLRSELARSAVTFASGDITVYAWANEDDWQYINLSELGAPVPTMLLYGVAIGEIRVRDLPRVLRQQVYTPLLVLVGLGAGGRTSDYFPLFPGGLTLEEMLRIQVQDLALASSPPEVFPVQETSEQFF